MSATCVCLPSQRARGADGLAGACFGAGTLQIPQETLYKKNVLITRGRFRPFTLLHNDMLQGAWRPPVPWSP